MSAELRAAQRQRVLKAAKIILDDWGAIDCIVRDMSETGTKIKIDSTSALPHKFKLLITMDNTIRPVQVAWKFNNLIGVAFTGEATHPPMRKLLPVNNLA